MVLYKAIECIHARPTVRICTYVPVWENHLDGALLLTATLWSLQTGQFSQVKHFLLLILKVRVVSSKMMGHRVIVNIIGVCLSHSPHPATLPRPQPRPSQLTLL